MSETKLYDVGGVLLEQPFKIARLGHVGLYMEDIDTSSKFFEDVIGFRRTDVLAALDGKGANRGYFLTHNTDHHSMAVISADVARSRDDRYTRGITVNQLSFQVGTLHEMIHAYRLLKNNGADIWRVGRDRPGSNYAVYFQDPDGHTVELFYGMEQIGWDGLSKPMKTFAHLSRTTEPELPQPSEADEIAAVEQKGQSLHDGHRSQDLLHGSFDVGGITLPRPFRVIRHGPVSLFVKDLEASVKFYSKQLGLTITEEVMVDGHRCVFLRAGTEHHTIGLIPLELRTELGLAERTTVASYGLKVATYRQLKDAVEYLRQQGVKEVHLPDGLHPGIEYAAHFIGPEGHCLQLYFDMESIGWDGKPRPESERRKAVHPWPDTIAQDRGTYADRVFYGPLG